MQENEIKKKKVENINDVMYISPSSLHIGFFFSSFFLFKEKI